MQFFFYCHPDELKEIFSEIESACPMVYEPRFGYVSGGTELDPLLRKPIYSCKDFFQFGKACCDTPPFDLYTPEDGSRERRPPNLLYFSGPPDALTDPKVLCEGSLFLEPENKEDAPRALYKNIRRLFAKRFIKAGYCFISPSVYASRGEYLFIQRDYHFLAPAWRFDCEDRHVPIDIDDWYQMNGKMREHYQTPVKAFRFFAARKDLEQILCELEASYHLKYIKAVPHQKAAVYVCDQLHRMLLYLETDLSWDQNGKFAGASKASAIRNVYGDQLYYDFAAKVKERFQEIEEPHYGPFYISPILYTHRRDIIFSFDDPYFRIDENGKAVPVWRKEWEELQEQWK